MTEDDHAALSAANEQLSVKLEGVLEDNARLTADLNRSRQAVALLASERSTALAEDTVDTGGAVEEELRSAYEELQVLAEELGVSNTNLQEANLDLDARVVARTNDLNDTMLALRSLADLVPDLLWRTDPAGQANWFNERWHRVTGQDRIASFGHGWFDALHPGERDAARVRWDAAIEDGIPYQGEHRICGSDGTYRWFLVRAEPARNSEGVVAHWFAAGTDIDDQRVTLDALQQSELRFRTLVEGMPQLIWRAVEEGNWTWSSPQWREFTGLSDAESMGGGWMAAVHPEDRIVGMERWSNAEADEGFDMAARIFNAKEGRYRHFRVRALPARGRDGDIVEWLGTCTDVDDTLQLQERQTVLVAELQHRTRNLMAVVHAITLRTLKTSRDLSHFRECIDDRLQALARVQGLLSRREGAARIPFEALIRDELGAHDDIAADGRGERVTLDGPAGVTLRSATIQTLALTLHELATNAVKYGAFANPGGHLTVSWRLGEREDDQRRLTIDWRESGVTTMPGSGLASRKGYGRELIERALPYQLGAKTYYEFEPDGVHCTIEILLTNEDIAGEGRT